MEAAPPQLRRFRWSLLAASSLLAAGSLLAGCGTRQQQVFAYRLSDFPLRTALATPRPSPDPLPQSRLVIPMLRRPRHRGARRASSRLDLNHAPLSLLERVPGLTPTLAARIIAARPFATKRSLLRRGFLSLAAYTRAKRFLVVHRHPRSRRLGT